MSHLSRRAFIAAVLASAEVQAAPERERTPKKRKQPAPVALVGGTLLRAGEKPLVDAVIVTDAEGRIAYVGDDEAQASVGRPTPTRVDVKGKTVTGGLCDPLTQVGLVEVSLEPSTTDQSADEDDPIRAAFRTADGYNPDSTLVAIARQQGLTSVGVIPSGGLVTGQSAYVDLHGERREDTMGRELMALHVRIDDGAYGSYEGNRANAWLRLRELIADTKAFAKNPAAYDRRQLRRVSASRLDLVATQRALEGEVPTVIHADRASDIRTALRLGEDEGLRLVLASAAEGWKAADAIAEADVPVVIYPLDHGPRSFAARGAREDNAKRLHEAGVRLAFSTGSSHNVRKLRQAAGNAVRAGLPHEEGVSAIVDGPARAFGLGDDYGSPKRGRRANLVVWSGDPLEFASRVERMYIRGARASLRSRQTALFERYR